MPSSGYGQQPRAGGAQQKAREAQQRRQVELEQNHQQQRHGRSQQQEAQAGMDPALEAAWGASVARADPTDIATDSRPVTQDVHGARPAARQQQQVRTYHDPYRPASDGLADAWAAADGRLPERPDTAESQFYENRAKAMGGAAGGMPWADHTSSQPDQPPIAGSFRPTTPWAPDSAIAASDAAAMAAYGKPKKVKTPWATQQSIDGGMPAAAPDHFRPRPSSAASSQAPWEQEPPRHRTQRAMVSPPNSPGGSGYSDTGAPRSPYGSGGTFDNRDYGDIHPNDQALQTAWDASIGQSTSGQVPPSPSGIQVRHRNPAPFAEEPALESAWAASIGSGVEQAGRGGPSGYGPHDVPPWEGSGGAGLPKKLGGALPGLAQAEAEDAMAAAWEAGGGGKGPGPSGATTNVAPPWASHKGARGNTEPDPELEAAWAVATGVGAGPAPAVENDYDQESQPVVRRQRGARPAALQPPGSPGGGTGGNAPWASHPGGRGVVDPGLEAAWGASVAPADPQDLAEHPPSPARLKHPNKRLGQKKKTQSGRSRLQMPRSPAQQPDGGSRFDGRGQSVQMDKALEAAWGASVAQADPEDIKTGTRVVESRGSRGANGSRKSVLRHGGRNGPGTAPQPKARSKSTRKEVEASAEETGLAPLRYRQFRGVAWPPSRPPPQSTGTLPASKLVLHHVHGYRGADCRDNVHFTADGELLYFVAGVAVVADIDRNTQRFFTGHDDDIVSLALHPDGTTVATGQIGRHATVCIWDSRSGRLITKLQKVAERRVASLSFSPDGARLIVVGGDDYHTIKVLDWRRATLSIISEARGHGNDVLAVRYNPYLTHSTSIGGPDIVQCGAKHLKFWATAKGGSLTTVTPTSSKTGPKMKMSQHFLCVAFFPDASTVVGAASGDIFQFRGQELASVLPNAHQGFVSALRVLPDGGSLCSAGKDGRVVVWGGTGGIAHLEAVVEMDLADVLHRPGVYGRAIGANETGDVLAVGTSRNEIVCFDRREGTLKTIVVTQGHSASVSGLAMDMASPSFATCADDKTLRLWCLRRGLLLGLSQLPMAGRACAISPHGDAIVVGLSSGGLQVHDADTLRVTYENPKLAKESISDLKFSPDGQTLACASHDNMIYLLDTDGWRQYAVLSGHSSYVSHVDW
eukprot:COSAG02_NODE_1888_length_10500_cov_3.026536_4_plen_1147_part_00